MPAPTVRDAPRRAKTVVGAGHDTPRSAEQHCGQHPGSKQREGVVGEGYARVDDGAGERKRAAADRCRLEMSLSWSYSYSFKIRSLESQLATLHAQRTIGKYKPRYHTRI